MTGYVNIGPIHLAYQICIFLVVFFLYSGIVDWFAVALTPSQVSSLPFHTTTTGGYSHLSNHEHHLQHHHQRGGMLATFPAPVLSITADAVKDLEGRDALSGLWTCRFSLFRIAIHNMLIITPTSVYEMQGIFARRTEIGEHFMAIVVSRDDARRFEESTLPGEND